MPTFNVEKTIHIQSSLEKVFDIIRDFRQWQPWSPWLIAEPGCQVDYAEDGSSYSWDGQIIGSGEMLVKEEEKPKQIHYQLTFIKPWKSTCPVKFILEEDQGGVKVTWTMEGSLPFFMFFMNS